MYYYNYGIEYIFIITSIIITIGSQIYINNKYKETKKIKTKKGLKGYEVARKILDENGLSKIKVKETSGILSDHYDPINKEVRLSTSIYNEETIASVSVAAHECGHAIQDKNNYIFLKIRSMIIPLVNISSKFGYIAIMIGLFSRITDLIIIGIIFEIVILVFQIITLPVEFNASKRGLKEIQKLELVEKKELKKSKEMLTAAALTYVASVASTLLEIFRLLMMGKLNHIFLLIK